MNKYPFTRSLIAAKLIMKEKLFHYLKNPPMWKWIIGAIGMKENDGMMLMDHLQMLWKL
jgi:hypothetical protein